MLGLLILGLAAAADVELVDDTKALACLTLTKVRMADDQSTISALVDDSPLPRDDINNKLVTNMLLYCYDHVSNETVSWITAEMNTFQLNDTLRALVPLPSKPYESEGELQVSTDRKKRFSTIVERAKYLQQLTEYMEIQDQWYSGKMGVIYMLGVFALFGYGMVKLFRGLGTTAKKGKKTK